MNWKNKTVFIGDNIDIMQGKIIAYDNEAQQWTSDPSNLVFNPGQGSLVTVNNPQQ